MDRVKFTPEDAAYGLRNLFVMDDEETRIDGNFDFGDEKVQNAVENLIAESQYEDAYRVAIRHAFQGLTKPERDKIITDWANEWNKEYREDYADEDEEITDEAPASDLRAMADSIMWMTENEWNDWQKLLHNEHDFVADMRSFDSPGELVIAEIDTEYEGYQINPNDSGPDQLKSLLDNNWSWGEMLGAVVASFHLWNIEDQTIIRPALTRALHEAAQNGVDH